MRRYVAAAEAGLVVVGASLLASVGAAGALARTAYVANLASASVTPVNLATHTAGAPITIGGNPSAVAIAPDGKTAYVANFGSANVTPINVATNMPGTPIPVGSGPGELAITPNGKTAYVPNSESGSVTPIDLATDAAEAPITVGTHPTVVAITPDGRTAYVAGYGSESVIPIDLATNTAGTPIMVGDLPEHIAITPDGRSAYVVNRGSQSVTPLDLATNTAGAPIMVGIEPEGIAIAPDGRTAYVANYISETVTPINLATNMPGSPIAVGTRPRGIAITPDGSTAYFTAPKAGTLTPIGLASQTAGTPIMLGGGESGPIAIVPDSGPAAGFSASPAPAGQAMRFDGSGSSDPEGTVTSYAWSFGDGTSATTASPTLSHVYEQPGNYTVTLRVTDSEGCSSAFLFTGQTAYCSAGAKATTSRVVTIPPQSTTATPLPTASSPLIAPMIGRARESASRWRAGNKLAQISARRRRPSVGTTFSFSLNERASVDFSFSEQLSGRQAGHKCLARTPKNAKHRRCMRTRPAGTLSFAGHAGANSVGFQGRISPSKRLAPGSYTLTITATNSAGARARPASLSFTIVR